jgi:para-nitrobenzyl esterase
MSRRHTRPAISEMMGLRGPGRPADRTGAKHVRQKAIGIIAVLSGVLALTMGLVSCGGGGVKGPGRAAVVATSDGRALGVVTAGYRAFLGIPYAAAPIGSLRWKAPVAGAVWKGVRDATHLASPCLQLANGTPTGARGSENCLYLNIYTPTTTHGARPVLIWLHGGGFTAGSGNDVDPAMFVERNNEIVVTVNYRLGPLGFLALPALTAESGTNSSGQFGLLDQASAVRWIHDNIGFFGGSAQNLTLGGQSAGAISTCLQMTSPVARLVRRVILDSGCSQWSPGLVPAQQQGERVARVAGCSPTALSCLRALPVQDVLKAAYGPGKPAGVTWLPPTGGSVYPRTVQSAIKAHTIAVTSVLQGTTAQEGTLFVQPGYDSTEKRLKPADYTAALQSDFGGIAKAVARLYPAAGFASPGEAMSAAVTDGEFACSAVAADEAFAASGTAYASEFADPKPPPVGIAFTPTFPLGSFHGSDLSYVFRTPGTSLSAPQRVLSEQMMRYWGHFIEDGDPNGGGNPAWSRVEPRTSRVLVLTPAGTTMDGTFASRHRCAEWAAIAQ